MRKIIRFKKRAFVGTKVVEEADVLSAKAALEAAGYVVVEVRSIPDDLLRAFDESRDELAFLVQRRPFVSECYKNRTILRSLPGWIQ